MLSKLPIPDRQTFYLIAALAAIGLIASFIPALTTFWKILAVIIAVILLADLFISTVIANPKKHNRS